MPRTYKPRPKLYTEASVAAAIQEVADGATERSTAKKYHMSTFMLRQRYLQSQGLIALKKQGSNLDSDQKWRESFQGT